MMKKILTAFVIGFLGLSHVALASLSKQIVDYRIKAKLIPEEKAVSGQERLTWLNDSRRAISELQFHLYLNAFKNSRSTFMKESRGAHRGFRFKGEDWGYIEIKKIQIARGADLTGSIEYIQPDDGNKDDQTVMRLRLPKPVPPGEKIAVDIEFYSKLPKIFARSGFRDNFYMVAQWFPKIGVLRHGQWNCHQYHLNSEFFADFGVYDVEITVPEDYVIGACGKKMKEIHNADGTKTLSYYQEDIHDFAWAACPDFVEYKEKFALENPRLETEIILLIHRSHLNQKDRYLSALKNGIEFYSQSYGAYPYPTITLIDPPLAAAGAGGMEYPTLFTSITASFLPKGFYLPEMVTIHEFGHNYWYGIVASNEFEEAWLDEGINSYSEIKAMARYYGEQSSMIDILGKKVSDLDFSRFQVIGSSIMDPILKNSWEYSSSGSYAVNSYQKAALMLLTLENFLGEDVMARVMRTYFNKWKFKHPTSKNFIAVAEEVSGQNLSWFFDQFLSSTGKVDYAVKKVSAADLTKFEEIPEKKEKPKERKREEEKQPEKTYRNEVVVVRNGDWVFPQEILFEFEQGERILEKWDGRDRWKRFVYLRPYKLKLAHLDPENKVLLDVNFKNNSMLLKPKRISPLKYALKWMHFFQAALSLIQ